MPIRILPPTIASQIAAGEVIERPASVVKELVENALDAGARHITVEVLSGGKRLMRISDDGHGIPADEVEIAFERHATSKIETVEDLDLIATLGFRGEALAAIASVSRVTLTTRATGEQMGTRVYVEGGELREYTAVGAPQGTVIEVENLFFNVPARLKFLNKETTERKHIAALMTRYAMAYPDVRFRLIHEGQEVLHTTGSSDLRQVIKEVYGLEMAEQMIEVEGGKRRSRSDLHPVLVSGYVSQPSLNRSNRTHITLFVNGRWVQDSSLTYAIVQAYHTMLMTGRYPIAVVMVNVPPEEVDVNVHPAKSEVRFRRQDVVFSAVQRAVRQALVEGADAPALRNEAMWGSPDWAARRERLKRVTGERLDQLGLDMAGGDRGGYSQQRPDEPQPVQGRKKRDLPMLRAVGQVGATYIVAEGPDGMYLIDQHAAHERVLYEQFMAEQTDEPAASQEMLEAVAVEMLPEQFDTVAESLDLLDEVGFRVELFGKNTVQLRAVPVLVAESDPREALLAAVGDIECGEMPTEATAEEKLISRVCKQAAIKAGQVLSYAEMQALLRQLEECDAPRTCPHGRPTMLHISADQLAKEFGRLGAI